jgi:hypothetical protein
MHEDAITHKIPMDQNPDPKQQCWGSVTICYNSGASYCSGTN